MVGDRLIQLLLFSTYFWGAVFVSKNLAQITPDASLGNETSILTENETINQNQVVDLIEGGADRDDSLFHSFEEFNVLPEQQVYFANPGGIKHIVTRVTGGNISEIFGSLGVDGKADLFLLNPNGILFGEDAALDIQGSFVATTADSYIFKDDIVYSAVNPEVPPMLKIKIPEGLQLGSGAGSIEVRGTGHNLNFDTSYNSRPSGLEVPQERTLALIGGKLNLNGGNLTSLGGTIELAAIAQTGTIDLKKDKKALEFDYDRINNYGNITLSEKSSIEIVIDKEPGSIELRGKDITLENASTIIGRTIGSDKKSKINIIATNSLNIINDNLDNFPSAIFSEAQEKAEKQGPEINLEATSLNLENNALIISTTQSEADGGSINIVANQADLVNNPDLPYSTGIYSQALSGAKGDVGIITLKLDNLQLLNNGQGIFSVNDEDDLENIIGKDRAEDLEDFIEDNENNNNNIIIGLSRFGQRTLVLQDGGQITSTNNGDGEGGVAIVTANTIQFLDAPEPEVPEPEVPEPEVPEPEVSEPEVPEPEVPEPEVPEPEVPEPEVPEPEVSEPEVPKPEVPEPEVPEPEVPEPEVPEPEVPEPEVPEPEVPEPEVPEPEVPEPEVPEPKVPEPEVPEPEVPEPEVPEPEVPEPEVPEPEVPEPEVPEPKVPEPEVPEPEVSEPVVSEPVVSDVVEKNLENEDQQPNLVRDSSIQKTYIFRSANGQSFAVDAGDLNKIIESSSSSNSANNSAEESEPVQMFINGILVAKNYDPDFDLTSACRIGSSNFVSVGRGGVAENPFNGTSQNITIPDLKTSSQQSTKSFPDFELDTVELTQVNPVIEARSWKINQEGKVELISASQPITQASIKDLPNCLRDYDK